MVFELLKGTTVACSGLAKKRRGFFSTRPRSSLVASRDAFPIVPREPGAAPGKMFPFRKKVSADAYICTSRQNIVKLKCKNLTAHYYGNVLHAA